MESAGSGTAASQVITVGTLITTLQPQVDILLERIYQSSSGLFPNSTSTEEIANQIATYEAIEVAVRRRRNSLVAINRLPIDIVHCIFAEALDLDRIHDADFPLDRVEAHRKHLFRLRCVSVSWNEFCLVSSRYWSAINLGVSEEIIVRTMKRAQQAPLCLYALLPTSPAERKIWDVNHPHRNTLQNQIDQVRSIRTNSPEASKFFKTLLSHGPSLLETLDLTTWPQSSWGADIIVPLPTGLERLRQIKAVDWRPNAAASQLCKLQTLVLRGWAGHSAKTIHLLAECTNLQKLFITFHETRNDGRVSGPTELLPAVTLPRLQELVTDFRGIESFKFLIKRLTFPPGSKGSVRIEQVAPQHPEAEVMESLCNFILPSTATQPVLNMAVLDVHCHPDPHPRIIYSAGFRSVDLGGPTPGEQAVRFVKMITAFQTRLNRPPLTIILHNCRGTDGILRYLADVDARKVLIKSPTDINGVLRLMENGSPSGTAAKPKLSFGSLQELIIEDTNINAQQLTGMVARRKRHLGVISGPCIEKISLVKCHLTGASLKQAAKGLGELGVVLGGTGCTVFSGKQTRSLS
ncbi:hypothetical protein FRC05_003737 [Tulasnella sp. 425]|nr:hypothetical protein FRC05_003737 [Tulasnella sp. 425]